MLKGKDGDVVIMSPRERYDLFTEALSEFVQNGRSDADALTRLEFLAMDSFGKLIAARQATIDNLAAYHAAYPRSDVAPSLMTLITIMSDAHGFCSMSAARMAKFFSRSRGVIFEALARLKEQKLIFAEAIPGASTQHRPYIHNKFGSSGDALTWLLDVRAPVPERGKAGRPRTSEDPEIPVRHTRTPIPENTRPAQPDTYFAEPEIPVRLEANTRPAYPDTNPLESTDDDKVVEARAPEPDVLVSDEQMEIFNNLYNTWGTKPGAIILNVAPRSLTDKLGLMEAMLHVGMVPDELLKTAIHASLTTMLAKRHDEAAARTSRGSGGASMLAYFRRVLASEIIQGKRQRLADAKLAAEARGEQIVQEAILAKRLTGVERGGSGKRAGGGRPSMDDLADQAFNVTE